MCCRWHGRVWTLPPSSVWGVPWLPGGVSHLQARYDHPCSARCADFADRSGRGSRTSGRGAEGGRLDVPAPAARATGTTIDIQDLFFSTPARRKFLKTEATEYAHCAETVRRLALANPQVSFTLCHNGRTQLRLNAEPASARVRQVLGEAFEQNSIAVEAAAGVLRVSGWVIRPSAATGSHDSQHVFVNGRYVRDKLIVHALKEAYRDVLL